MQQIIENRPMTMGEIFSTGWGMFTKNAKEILIASAIFFLPVSLLDGYFQMLLNYMNALVSNQVYPMWQDAVVGFLGMVAMPSVVITILTTVLLTLGQAVVYTMIYSYIDEQPLSIREASRLVGRRIIPLMGGQICAGVFIVIAICLFIIPGIYVVTIWQFFFMFMLFRGEGITESFSSSHRLVRGKWWFSFGVLVIITVISWTMSEILGLVLSTDTMVPAIIHAFLGYCVDAAFYGVAIVYFLHREALVTNQSKHSKN